jgi:hypothetical protein
VLKNGKARDGSTSTVLAQRNVKSAWAFDGTIFPPPVVSSGVTREDENWAG